MMICVILLSLRYGFFFFKQKTAYEMRISDWSSDVCSSDLLGPGQVLHWLTSSATIAELPVMPQVNGGEHPALVRRLPINDHQQYFLRLWPSHIRLDDGRPLWVGSVMLQEGTEERRVGKGCVSTCSLRWSRLH